MGTFANVLLKVKSRRALRGVIERRRAAESGARDPGITPYADGSAHFFTGIRFDDRQRDFAIRAWLTDEFGDALSAIHDDPRGVFVFSDGIDLRGKSYDEVLAEVGAQGVFVAATLVTTAEREAALQKMMDEVESFETARPTMAMSIVVDPSMLEEVRAPFDLDGWLNEKD